MKGGIYEKDSEIWVWVVGGVGGERVIVLGGGGVGKSMVGGELKSGLRDGDSFE